MWRVQWGLSPPPGIPRPLLYAPWHVCSLKLKAPAALSLPAPGVLPTGDPQPASPRMGAYKEQGWGEGMG